MNFIKPRLMIHGPVLEIPNYGKTGHAAARAIYASTRYLLTVKDPMTRW